LRKVYEVLANESNEFRIAEVAKIKPTGQVLADSDACAFIYIVEENEQYSYLTFGKELWPALISYVKEERNPVLQIAEQSIELDGFFEEMAFLVQNIQGNSNYGEAFVEEVERVFAPILDNPLV